MARHVNTGQRNSKYCFKIILLGDYNVGKSSLFSRFRDNTFKEQTRATIGTDNHSKVILVDDKNVNLILWDTVGTERYRTLTRNYFRNAHACLLVYSVDEPDTLGSLSNWVQDSEDFADTALKILVGNKNDSKSSIDQDKVAAFAQHHDCDIVFNVSAKTGEGVHEMFKLVAEKLVLQNNRMQQTQHLFEERDVRVLDSPESPPSSSSCC